MRVYHFLPADHAIEDIKKQRIKISEISHLNDPFELWCFSHEDSFIRRALHLYKKKMAKQFGMICFCRYWHNPLLWSHYADKHRGLCLGFDADKDFLEPVRYVAVRENLEIPPTDERSNELLYTKYLDWQYEEEWRAWCRLNERENGHYFYYFHKRIQLQEVIAGPLCTMSKKMIEETLKDYGDSVAIIKARLAFNTFRVVENLQGFSSAK